MRTSVKRLAKGAVGPVGNDSRFLLDGQLPRRG